MSFMMRVLLLSLLISLNLGVLSFLRLIVNLLRRYLVLMGLSCGVWFLLPIIVIVISLFWVVGLLTRGPRICLMFLIWVMALRLVDTLIRFSLSWLWLGGRLLHWLSLLLWSCLWLSSYCSMLLIKPKVVIRKILTHSWSFLKCTISLLMSHSDCCCTTDNKGNYLI